MARGDPADRGVVRVRRREAAVLDARRARGAETASRYVIDPGEYVPNGPIIPRVASDPAGGSSHVIADAGGAGGSAVLTVELPAPPAVPHAGHAVVQHEGTTPVRDALLLLGAVRVGRGRRRLGRHRLRQDP